MGFEIDGLQDDAADEAEEPGGSTSSLAVKDDVDFLYEEELRRFQHLEYSLLSTLFFHASKKRRSTCRIGFGRTPPISMPLSQVRKAGSMFVVTAQRWRLMSTWHCKMFSCH